AALLDLFHAGPAARPAVVEALVDLYTGALFRAALQLWVAASNEEQLRPQVTELEARVGRETHRIAVELLGADESVPGVRETVQGLLDMARGLGLANVLTDDTARRARVVAQWSRILDDTLG
ncbi:TetR family transcriptional regulator, partial [Streptomyces sp. NRRL S-444]